MTQINSNNKGGFKPGPFEYHEEIEVEIFSLTNMGQGVARTDDNWVILIPFCLPGEKVVARIYRNQKNYSEADLLRVISPSPERVSPECNLFGKCGGCQYQHLNYSEQLRWKKSKSKNYCYTWLTSHLKWTKSLHLLINILTGQN